MLISPRGLLTLSALCFSFLLGPACKKEASESGTKVGKIERPLLYKVSGTGGATGYLFGTMHAGIDAESELPESVWKVLDASGTLAIETNVMDPSLATALMRNDGTTLRDEFGEEGWAEVEKALGEKMANALLEMKAPAVVTALVMRDLDMTIPMEIAFLSRAIDGDKKREYLETPSEQIKILIETYDVERVLYSIREYKKEDLDKLMSAYRTGSEEALAEILMDPEAWGKDAEAAMEKMLYARNRNWIPGIEKLLERRGVFIAVGAGHLIGKSSVLALLRAKGYTVERMQ